MYANYISIKLEEKNYVHKKLITKGERVTLYWRRLAEKVTKPNRGQNGKKQLEEHSITLVAILAKEA